MLIAYYRFNNNLNDEMKRYHLTHVANSGAIVPSSGILGSGYQRPAVNNGIDRFSTVQQVYLHGSHSYSCWAFVTGLETSTANGLITNHDHNANTGSGITVRYISSTDFRISCNTGNGTSRTFHTYYGTTNIKDKWCHLAFTYDGPTQELKLWVNGNLELTQPYAMKTKPDPIEIFNWSVTNGGSNNYRPACILDEVRIYNHCLSTKEIKDLYLAKSLHLSADSGLTIDKEGKYVITPTNILTSTAIKNSLAYQFTGNSSLLVNNSEYILGNMSVEFWLYPENIPSGTRQTIFNKGYGSEGAINITSERRIEFFSGNGNGNTPTYIGMQSVHQLPLSQWTHVIAVKDLTNSQMHIYINGELDSSVTNSYIPQASTVPLTIGSGYAGNLIGKISNLVVYGSTIDSFTAKYLYENRASLDNYGNFLVDVIEESNGFIEDWDNTISYITSGTTYQMAIVRSNVLLTSTTSSPYLDMQNLGSFDPAVFKFIQIRYKVTAGSPTAMSVNFYNSLYSVPDSSQLVSGTVISNGTWNLLTLDMSQNINWTNSYITGWQFNWANASGVTMEIDFIQLVKVDLPYSIEKTGKLLTNRISELAIRGLRSLRIYINFAGNTQNLSTVGKTTIITSPVDIEYSTLGLNEQGSGIFNGSSSFISVVTYVGTTSFTLSTWIYRTSTAISTIFNKGNSHKVIINNSNKIEFFTSNSSSIVSNAAISNNTWIHIAVTFDSSVAKIFINGELDTAANLIYNFDPSSDTFIGKDISNINYFSGNMYDFRIYAESIEDIDIKRLYTKYNRINKLQSTELHLIPGSNISEI